MLEKIMDLVKGQVKETVDNDPEVPQEKKGETVETATSSIMDSIRSYATPDNISRLTSLLQGGTSGHDAARETGISGGVESNLISSLTSKAGLNAGTASKIAASIIPALISKLTSKTVSGPGFNIGSLLSSFTGNGGSDSEGGLMDKISGIFGNKN